MRAGGISTIGRRRTWAMPLPAHRRSIPMATSSDIVIDKEIDARGSFCPGPLMELIRGIKVSPVGGVLAVLSSDPGSAKDIPAWVQKAKHDYLGAFPEQGYTRFVARKSH